MIIKSSQRAGHKELASHLMKQRDLDGTPQMVTVTGSRHLITGDDVYEALDDMALMAQASDRCKQDLYHVSMNPAHPMDEVSWDAAWTAYETEFGLTGPFIEVTHVKGDNRPPHKHRVYERVDVQTGRAVTLSHTYARNEKIARLVEYTFGHDLTIGKHNRSVMKRFQEDGEHQIVAWMKAGKAHQKARPAASQMHNDVQQEKRTNVLTRQVISDLQDCFNRTNSGRTFEIALAEKGYILARGDRRDYVVIDWQGGVHSPRRRLGVKAKALHQKWADLKPQNLPTVAEVHQTLQALKATNAEVHSKENQPPNSSTAHQGTDYKLCKLTEEKLATQALITALEKEIEPERLRKELNYWQRQTEPERERVKPRQNAERQSMNSHSTLRGQDTFSTSGNSKSNYSRENFLQFQGQRAIAERENRLRRLQRPLIALRPGSVKASQSLRLDTAEHAALSSDQHTNTERLAEFKEFADYYQAWHERFQLQTSDSFRKLSRMEYRQADRWILQKLAQKGYSRQQAQRIVLQASPEIMNQRPNERLNYIKRLAKKVYNQHGQQAMIEQYTNKKERDKVRPHLMEKACHNDPTFKKTVQSPLVEKGYPKVENANQDKTIER